MTVPVPDILTADLRPGVVEDRCRRLLIGAALAMAWLWAAGYPGIVHDGRLYAFEALAALQPDLYRGDLFVAYGSQGNYSVFGILYGLAIRQWGLEVGSAVLSVAAQGLWFLSAYLLARRLPPPVSWLFLGLCAVLPRHYGMESVLAYRETFVTARPWAEAAVLFAAAAALGRRPWLAGIPLLIAFALHPLLGITGAGLVYGLLFRPTTRWLALPAAAVILAVLLAVAGVPPFDGLFKRYDAAWLDVVRNRNPVALVGEWPLTGLNRAMLAAAVLWMATRLAQDAVIRRLTAGSLALGLLGLAISYVGADLLHSRLVTQLQPWRALWLGQVMVALGAAVLITAPGLKARRPMLLAALGAWLAVETAGGVMALAIVAAFQRHGTVWPQWLVRAAYGLAGTGLCLGLAAYMPGHSAIVAQATADLVGGTEGAGIGMQVLFLWPVTLAIALLQSWVSPAALGAYLRSGFRAWAADRQAARLFLGITAAAILSASSFFNIHLGSAGPGRLKDAPPGQHPFATMIPPGSQVFWDGSAASVWFLLERNSYLAVEQGAGALFDRRSAMEYARRARNLLRFGFRDGDIRWFHTRRDGPPGPLAPGTVQGLCEDPILDFAVLGQPADFLPVATFVDDGGRRWFLYACSRER